MKLKSLQLENFRCFETLDLELDGAMTLLIGLNASGKTAILDALATALGAWLRGTAQARSEDRPIRPTDARLVRQETKGLPTANPSFPVTVTAWGTVDTSPIMWSRQLLHDAGPASDHSTGMQMYAQQAEKAATLDPRAELPLLAYYGTGRLGARDRDPTPQIQLGSRMQGYVSCLEPATNTQLFQQWMAWREDDRLQRIASAHERGADLSTIDAPHLDAVVDAAKSCLEGARRLFYSANHKELRIELDDGRVLPFERLSDGQRGLVVLAADLAWRAAQLNPHYGREAPARTAGVVLIDEIELHLHPSWQRRIIDDLMRTFPRMQFVATTHSPQVISTAQAQWLRVLRADSVGRVEHARGKDTNAILWEIMGVPERPRWMEEQLGTLEQLIEEDDLPAARALIEQLRQSVGPTDRSLVALEWELHDRELGDAND